MISSTLNKKELHFLYSHPSKQDCFRLKGPCQHQARSMNKLGPFDGRTDYLIYKIGHLRMKHKINKIHGNLCTNGKHRISQRHLFSQYDDHERNYKPVSDRCLSLILDYGLKMVDVEIVPIIYKIGYPTESILILGDKSKLYDKHAMFGFRIVNRNNVFGIHYLYAKNWSKLNK